MRMSIPFFYSQTKIGVLTRDESFLEQCSVKESAGENHVVMHKNTESLMQDCANRRFEQEVEASLLESEETSYGIHTSILNLNSLPLMIAKGRVDHYSTLIIDASVFDQDNYALICCLRTPFLKRILIGTSSDVQMALGAFNVGLIDRFLEKDTPSFVEELEEAMKCLSWDYFASLSRFLGGGAENCCCLVEKASFGEWLYRFVRHHQVSALCLIDMSGVFLVKKRTGVFYVLKVVDAENEQDILEALFEKKGFDETIMGEILKYKKTFLYFENHQYKYRNSPGPRRRR